MSRFQRIGEYLVFVAVCIGLMLLPWLARLQ